MVFCRAKESRLIEASGSLKDPSKKGVYYFLVIIIIYVYIYLLKKVQHVHQNCPPVKFLIKTNGEQNIPKVTAYCCLLELPLASFR